MIDLILTLVTGTNVLTAVQTHCAFSQKIAPVLNTFACKFFVLFQLLLSGQVKLSTGGPLA